MLWFKNAYDRASCAEYVLTNGPAEEVCPGYKRTTWNAKPLGVLAIMSYYEYRNVYDRETASLQKVHAPFYSVHFNYLSPAGDNASAVIDFDQNFAYLRRSSELVSERPTKPTETEIWDQGMAALDESLVMHATRLGWASVEQAVEIVQYPANVIPLRNPAA